MTSKPEMPSDLQATRKDEVGRSSDPRRLPPPDWFDKMIECFNKGLKELFEESSLQR